MINVIAEYQIELTDNGNTLFESKFSNLITNKAFSYGNPFSTGYVVVGTGNTQPRPADINLVNEVGQASATFAANSPITLISNKRYVRKQASTTITGIEATIAEVGFKKTTGADNLISRTLVRDGNGLVTTIPIQAHQELKITYFVYIRIPETLGTATIQTGYQSLTYTVEVPLTMTTPKGLLQGDFLNPSASKKLTAHLNTEPATFVDSNTIAWTYNIALRRAQGLAYFPAEVTSRTITHFTFESDSGLPIITLSEPMVNPEDNDITIPLQFTWGRGE